MRSQNFHDLFNDCIIRKTREVKARGQVIEGPSGIVNFFVTEELPIEKSWHNTLNDINDVLLKRLIAFIKSLLDINEKLLTWT